jgi:membrane protease YdiL (CAAX protease family)
MIRWGRFAAAYMALILATLAGAVLCNGALPLTHPRPWLHLGGLAAVVYSAALGAVLAGFVVSGTKLSVERWGWAQRLHSELRPFARGIAPGGVVALAFLSGLGEELLFRGVLQPLVGVVPQAVIFGLLHQIPGRSRWVWAAWAALAGLALGAIFQLTGSLVGPVVAHCMINGLNLQYLKRHDSGAQGRALGGLLGQRR